MSTSRDDEIRRCLGQLGVASTLLDGGNVAPARAVAARVRVDLERLAGDELTASLSLAFMFLEELETRLA